MGVIGRAVAVRGGWVGQVIVGERIIWQTDVVLDDELAEQLVHDRVAGVFEWLFADPETPWPFDPPSAQQCTCDESPTLHGDDE